MKKLTQEEIIERFRNVHGDRYDYSKVVYVNRRTNVTIICKEHGEFSQSPYLHGTGAGCRQCGFLKTKKDLTMGEDVFKKRADKIHGGLYNYDRVDYQGIDDNVLIGCRKHGYFEQTPRSHLKGAGCLKCSYESRGLNRRLTHEEVCEKIELVLGDYTYRKDFTYENTLSPITFTCSKHGDFVSSYSNFVLGSRRCPTCGKVESKAESFLAQYLLDRQFTVERNVCGIIGKSELDLFIPSRNLAIEFNGLIWHSDKFRKNPNYHLNKTVSCKNIGIDLIHIFEDEWLDNKDLILSMIDNRLGLSKRIYARKCQVRPITNKESALFLEANHLKGNFNAPICLGLFYDDLLVYVMTFSKPRISLGHKHSSDGEYELLRLCSLKGVSVVGGASKLLKYFVKNYAPAKIHTYADRRYSNGGVYEIMGFKLVGESRPNYFYSNNGRTRENRFKYRKSELVKQGFDMRKSESEIMRERGFYKIFDCGNYKYEMTLQ